MIEWINRVGTALAFGLFFGMIAIGLCYVGFWLLVLLIAIFS